ncbi:hypothetical protein ACHAXA_002552 [Cyclostephanos tholiformis]|uniref:18S rRNA (guanine(1575)-N(7))-methyltransferase Bud23 C-terminal domain-containing protein n=1 Tax=Cyclostephanos tholiformis TaxID=382380 RepID=A0ABD3R535_9STRA
MKSTPGGWEEGLVGGKRGEVAPSKKKGVGKMKEWILHMKKMQRKKGKDTRMDTKYAGRRSPTQF